MAVSGGEVRKDAQEKVTGQAMYVMDYEMPDMLYARMLTSPVAHGNLKDIDVSRAQAAEGVVAVITGSHMLPLTGVLLKDRPPLAIGRVRYAGEPVAVVVARSEAQAQAALSLIRLEIDPLPIIHTISDALAPDAYLLHADAPKYECLVDDVKPRVGTNIAAEFRIRKGDPEARFAECAQIVDMNFTLPRAAHLAMEPRAAQAMLKADGTLWILSATQSPYTARKLVADMLGMEPGLVRVQTALLGGGFGGKSAVWLEYIAALCALSVPGKRVKLIVTREEDMTSAPCKLALEANIKLGASADGKLLAGEMRFALDCGAYSDISPNMSKAIAVDCTGPYRLDDLSCDSITVYTNHTFVTAYRGFAHESYTFCVERALDALADALDIDPMTMREINSIRPGDYTPTQVEATLSNMGNPAECLARLKRVCNWDKSPHMFANGKVRAKGIACLWKTPNPSNNASACAVITFNPDGSCNLNIGVVEMGSGDKTQLCLMLAQKLRMDYKRVHVEMDVDTRTTPEYFKTVASLSEYLAAKAVMRAADDAIKQLKALAALVLKCDVEDLDYGQERVFSLSNPKFCIGYQDLVNGIDAEGGCLGKPVIGRGSTMMRHVGEIAEDTGKGKVGQAWTVGAQAVEVEYDPQSLTYRLINAWTVMDLGALIDEAATRAMIRGGMAMGLSLARGEEYIYDSSAVLQTSSMRTYKATHMGEEPRYGVEFVLTPQLDAPFGTRCYTEHGIIGMPAALGNALARAAGAQLNTLPLSYESIWRAAGGAKA